MINYPPSIEATVITENVENSISDGKLKDSTTVFNIRVTKFFEDKTSIDWSIIRSLDEFHDNHLYLVKNLGLLKKFHFSTGRSGKMFTFSDSKPVDLSAQVNEYLKELSVLNPIPTVVISFLALENITYAEKMKLTTKLKNERNGVRKSTSSSHLIDTSLPHHDNSFTEDIPDSDKSGPSEASVRNTRNSLHIEDMSGVSPHVGNYTAHNFAANNGNISSGVRKHRSSFRKADGAYSSADSAGSSVQSFLNLLQCSDRTVF